MAANYQVPQREVPAWLLTNAGWARGKFLVMRSHGFIESLENSPGLLKMRDVQLPGYPAPMAFFGVWRDSIALIVAEQDAGAPQVPVANGVIHHVTCLLASGVLVGKLQLRPGIRLSDHLQRFDGFLTLEDCTFQTVSGAPLSQGAMRVVHVNVKHLVGVTE